MASSLFFPALGCWEITAEAGGAGLGFVTLVELGEGVGATPSAEG